ncbi:protein white-like [Patiria miniata]|uniref:ABC transporter domain-containing protein n=1 Tax=Patiria miniata TaxID=46514 RepID=A0A914BM66_PATMI|nr:protein white-like [Patiria miniata]
MESNEKKPLFLKEDTMRSKSNDGNEEPGSTSNLTPSSSGYSAIAGYVLPGGDSAVGPGSSLPRFITPITLVWTNISVTLEPAPKRCRWFAGSTESDDRSKVILRDVSGVAEPGTLTAIMGASGSGKSSLLNALTGRNADTLTVTGQIQVNGTEVDGSLAGISAYVQQNDLFMEWLTVKEHLLFQASVRMDNSASTEERRQRVDEVIRSVGLSRCMDTVIGNPQRGVSGISGGERKRLAFASEVLTNPSLLFCDEPTTGLDSYMAHSVVSTLKNLASDDGRTVMCTIHQPPSAIYRMFDRLILVAQGAIAFEGSPKDAAAFFESLGHSCPPNYNPADYFIKTLAIRPSEGEQCRQRVQEITAAFLKSPYFDAIKEKSLSHCNQDMKQDGFTSTAAESPYKASWWRQFTACVRRAYLSNKREPLTSKIRLVQSIVLGLILGLVFLQGKIDQDGVQNITGVLFLLVSNSAFANTFTTVQVIPNEIALMKREHYSGMYRVDAWFLAKFVTELPVHVILLPLILVLIPYWMIGLYPAAVNFFTTYLVICLSTGTAISFAYFLSSVSRSISMALAIAPPFAFAFMLLGGLFINVADIPVWLGWFSYLSWFRFGFEALLINEWSNIDEIECPSNWTAPCIEDGQMVLEAFSFKESHFGMDLYCLAILFIGFRLLAFIILLYRCRRQVKH